MAMKLLFEAPLDFDMRVMEEYQSNFDMTFSGSPEILVCDPSAHHIIDGKILDLYPDLKIIATPSTGNNHIDLKAVEERGIKFLSLLDDREGLDTITASSEFTFKLILDALRIKPAFELSGKIIGLIGYGRIGQNIKRYADAFNAEVVNVHDPYKGGYETIEEVFTDSEIIVVCCSLTDETRNMIRGHHIRMMRENAVLVNTARGEIINEEELVEVMNERPDIRVALDVVHGETTGTTNKGPLLSAGAIITPHTAGETFDSRTKAAKIILELLRKETV